MAINGHPGDQRPKHTFRLNIVAISSISQNKQQLEYLLTKKNKKKKSKSKLRMSPFQNPNE